MRIRRHPASIRGSRLTLNPFKSQAQRAWMYANKPAMAKEWEAHTPKGKKLPKKVKADNVEHVHVCNVNPFRFDPTRTTTQRRAMMRELRKRFATLKLRLRQHILEELTPRATGYSANYNPDQPRDEHGRWGSGDGSASLLSRIKDKVVEKFHKMQARYGHWGAIAVMAGVVAMTPVPLPGTSLLPIAIAEGVRGVHHLLSHNAGQDWTVDDLVDEAIQIIHELYADEGEEPPKLNRAMCRLAITRALTPSANYSPDQPRDEHGKFAGTGAGTGGFREASPKELIAARDRSVRKEFLSSHTEAKLAGKRLYLSPDGKTGYMMDEHDDFGNLFNNGGPKGAGREAILHAIEHGAKTLDCFEGFLPQLYTKYGFQPTGAMKFNDEYAPAGWEYNKYGRPDVIMMRYAGGDRATIRDRVGTFGEYHHPGKYYTDYDQAKADSRRESLAGNLDQGPRRTVGRRKLGIAQGPIAISPFSLTDNVGTAILEVPDIRQPNHFYCGASATTAVLNYFGIKINQERVAKILGTTVQESTHPEAIIALLRGYGLGVDGIAGLTVDDLVDYMERGMPVICPVQDYAGRREPQAEFDYGHYLTVIGVVGEQPVRYVVCQDSSIENWGKVAKDDPRAPGGDVPDKEAQDNNLSAPGRVLITEDDWMKAWHDSDVNGKKYIRFGIAAGKNHDSINRSIKKDGSLLTGNRDGPDASLLVEVPYRWIAGTYTVCVPASTLTANDARYEFLKDPEKIEAFQNWLELQFHDVLLDHSMDELWQRYIEAGYRKGAGRAFDDVMSRHPELAYEPLDFRRGSRAQFLRSSFAQPETVEKVKLLASRAFDDLEGVTDVMSTQMSRTLTDGLVQGKHPRAIAKDLVDDVDGIGLPRANLIAQTEMIRAHAEGQLDALEDMGVSQVGVQVEFTTAGDNAVCPECADMEGDIYDIEDAHGIIPVHPNCRCAFLPAGPAITGNRTFERLRRAVRNVYCATGPGGGKDPTCSPKTKGALFQ